MRLRIFILVYHYVAGLADTITGLLLLFAPSYTLHRMGVTELPSPLFYARYIGIFVMATGTTYLLIPAVLRSRPNIALWWRAQWAFTALIRSFIALFLFLQIICGTIESAWIAVFLTDASFALLQWSGLWAGWFDAVLNRKA